MASQSPWSWQLKRTGYSAIKLPNSLSSSNSSIIFTFRTVHKKQTSLSTFSLDPSSSSSSSSRVCSASHNVGKGLRKSVKNPENDGDDKPQNEVSVNRPRSRKSRTPLSFKSLFGRKSLWRRIVFASRKTRSIILLNVITLIYAGNIPVVKEVEAIMDPSAFNVVRFAVSAIPFIPFVLRARGDTQTRNAGIELGFWISLGYLTQAVGLLTSDAGRASFISMFTVIVVPLLDGMLGAVIPARTWCGALMSISGVAMLESSGSPPSVGDLLNFLSAIFFGIHMVRTEHISRSTDRENFLPLLGYEVFVVAILSALWYFLGAWFGGIQGSNPSSWTWTMVLHRMTAFPWIPALYTGVFSTGLCLWVEMAAMRDVSATETAIIYGLEPVWGAGFAWCLLGERWGLTGWIGAALVLGGSLTVQILGSSSSILPSEGEDRKELGDHIFVSDERSGLTASPIVVNSRKDVPDVLKK